MKKLLLVLLPINVFCQPPNWPPPGNGPPQAPPGLDLHCWPPPCVSIGDLLIPALVLTAMVLAVNKIDNKINNNKKKNDSNTQ